MPKMQLRDAVPGTLLRAKVCEHGLNIGELAWFVRLDDVSGDVVIREVSGRCGRWSYPDSWFEIVETCDAA